jgi:hypothetical protein
MVIMTEARTETDKRIDDLRSDTRDRFDRVETSMRDGFARVDVDIRELRADNQLLRTQMDAKFEVVEGSLTDIRKLMIVFFASTLGSIVAAAVVAVLLHS